jgi:DNA processing protein
MATRTISNTERLNRLRLIRSDNVGAITWHRLVERFGSATSALEALPDLLHHGGARGARVCSVETAEREFDRAAAAGMTVLTHGEAGYPARLGEIDDAPPVLYVRGDAALLERPAVAIVGARNASANGRAIAHELARDLARSAIGNTSLAIVSGLARGIDAAAHDGALEAGGVTIAAMAGGADHVYPRENVPLYDRIVETGAAISEQPPGIEPQARHFPRRNRLVSGLSMGVVVVEAAARSGSLITARMALEQGREVFAVPGSPRDPRCRGTNALIRSGAVLTEVADDVVEALTPMLRSLAGTLRMRETVPRAAPELPETVPEETRRAVLDCLSPTPVTVDEIVRQCQVTASVVQMILLELELAGRLERQPGNRVAAL